MSIDLNSSPYLVYNHKNIEYSHGSEKELSHCPGKVDCLCGLLTFHSHWPMGKRSGKLSANYWSIIKYKEKTKTCGGQAKF